jgi:hypothetical protein
MRSVPRISWLVIFTALIGGAPAQAQGLHLLPGVTEVESDSIADIAVAAVDRAQPVIYLNPYMARRYGPLLTRFFLAHEYGHIYHRHTRAGLADTPEATRDSILRAQELQADCYAASQEGDEARAATEAALRFFARLGPFRFDNVHPTGAQRAARILLCLPGPRVPVTYGRGETGVEVGPVSSEPDRVRFAVRVPSLERSTYGNDAVLWMDGLRIGAVSNLRFPERMDVDRFGAGIHTYRLAIDVYSLDGLLQTSPTGSVSGRGHVLIQEGDRFRIEWIPGQAPALVRDSE